VDRVLRLVVSSEELARRLGGRLVCRGCQTPYQGETAPERCTACGGELYQREDDSPQAVCRRIEEYQTKTEPLVEYYRGQGKLRQVDGGQEIEAVSRDLLPLVTKERVSGA
jgi:adenylate kinase